MGRARTVRCGLKGASWTPAEANSCADALRTAWDALRWSKLAATGNHDGVCQPEAQNQSACPTGAAAR